MATEIERKFLVTGSAWRQQNPPRLSQGYLNRDPDRTVRVRVAAKKAFLTIKGRTTGIARAEFEYAIPLADAQQLLTLCEGPIIEKARHVLVEQGTRWEIDEFFGDNAGLIVAEVELDDERQSFERPSWLGQEVTHDPRYFNSNLAAHPYRAWRDRS